MHAYQLSFSFEFLAPDASAKKSAIGKVEVLPTWAKSLDDILKLAQKTVGWNNRSCPPQTATLADGCVLHVVPAHLWRSRIGARRRTYRTEPTQPGARHPRVEQA